MAAQGLLAGTTLGGRYEVLDLVGVGGMGEVYRARDRELDEVVAVKVIRDELVKLPGVLDQFRSEVKLARRVTHRNVARAFELGRSDGATYYTMELVDGASLSKRLHGRAVPVAEAAEIIAALCDALDAAHGAGVIHRDLKPDNVLIATDGRIVLADFGIAAAVRLGGGALAGTPKYMAPEQARGEEATTQADIYSLGVMLYELVSGQPGFSGSIYEVIAAKEEVDHLVLPDGDPRLVELVARATSKDPALRPRSALAMRRVLLPFLHEQAREVAEPSYAVAAGLPTVIVRWPTLEEGARPYLVEGFHQALLRRLATWPRLRVSARGAAALGAVDVAITAGAETLELRADLGDTQLVLREQFDAELLPEAAHRAAGVIAAVAGATTAPPAPRGRPLVGEPLDLVLQARYLARDNRSRAADAVSLAARALELVPGHPRVLATLGLCEAQDAFYTLSNVRELESATEHVFAAIAAEPDLAEAHLARGYLELSRGRAVAAAACFRTAIAESPLLAEAHEWLGRLLLEAGFIVDGLARYHEAKALSPHIGSIETELVTALVLQDRWEEAQRILDVFQTIAPNGGLGFWMRLAAWRRDPVAIAATHAQFKAGAPVPFSRELLDLMFDVETPWEQRKARILALTGNRAATSPRRRGFLAQLVAETAGWVGDGAECLRQIRLSVEDGLFDRMWLERCPLLDCVRGDLAYPVLLAEVTERADAIHDALFGDHRDLATSYTPMV